MYNKNISYNEVTFQSFSVTIRQPNGEIIKGKILRGHDGNVVILDSAGKPLYYAVLAGSKTKDDIEYRLFTVTGDKNDFLPFLRELSTQMLLASANFSRVFILETDRSIE